MRFIIVDDMNPHFKNLVVSQVKFSILFIGLLYLAVLSELFPNKLYCFERLLVVRFLFLCVIRSNVTYWKVSNTKEEVFSVTATIIDQRLENIEFINRLKSMFLRKHWMICFLTTTICFIVGLMVEIFFLQENEYHFLFSSFYFLSFFSVISDFIVVKEVSGINNDFFSSGLRVCFKVAAGVYFVFFVSGLVLSLLSLVK